MIRRSTLILLIVFAALVGLALYLQENPLPVNQTPTVPVPTEAALLLGGMQPAEIVAIERRMPTGEALRLAQGQDGTWTFEAGSTAVDLGTVEQLRTELVSLRPTAVLAPEIDRTAIGMETPTATIVMETAQGSTVTLNVGVQTPTGSGYYVQVDSDPPVVVNAMAIDGILNMLQREMLAPPTPEPTPTTG